MKNTRQSAVAIFTKPIRAHIGGAQERAAQNVNTVDSTGLLVHFDQSSRRETQVVGDMNLRLDLTEPTPKNPRELRQPRYCTFTLPLATSRSP